MKRHPALQPLSRDHHFLLHHAREIRWAVEGSPRAAPLDGVLRAFLEYWAQEGLLHLQEEEEILLPLPALAEVAPRIRAEHAHLRSQVARLSHEPGESAKVARQLHDHIRFEERVLFQRLQAILSEEALLDIGARSQAFRAHWRK